MAASVVLVSEKDGGGSKGGKELSQGGIIFTRTQEGNLVSKHNGCTDCEGLLENKVRKERHARMWKADVSLGCFMMLTLRADLYCNSCLICVF